ncbi:hypothetical protein [Cyanobium sp. ULC082]
MAAWPACVLPPTSATPRPRRPGGPHASALTYERLRDYLTRRMRMSHIYQPLIL